MGGDVCSRNVHKGEVKPEGQSPSPLEVVRSGARTSLGPRGLDMPRVVVLSSVSPRWENPRRTNAAEY